MKVDPANSLDWIFRTPNTLPAAEYDDVFVPDDDSRWTSLNVAAVLAFALGAVVAVEVLTNGGHFRFHLSAAMAILLIAEGVLLLVVLLHDQHRKKLLSFLKESEERTSLAAEANDLGLWQWDCVSDRFWTNAHCRKMLGLETGRNYALSSLLDSVHSDDRSAVEQAAQSALRSNKVVELEFRTSSSTGPPQWLRARALPLRSSDNRRVAGTIVDISERKAMQVEVEEQQQSLAHLTRVGIISELAGALAHELNQPLTAIMSNAQAAQRMIKTGATPDDLKDAISDIIDDDNRASEVIRHLRSFLKDGSSSFEQLDLNEVISSALELTKSDLINRHVVLMLQLSPERLEISADKIQLQQVILNIILNAAESMSERVDRGGVLLVSTDILPGRTAHLAISDNGPGIRADLMAKVFDPFVSSKDSGMGLGLSISRSIIARHAGRIWAVSNSEEGATFHINLPLCTVS
jgi:PAS domain S-box-containing protein